MKANELPSHADDMFCHAVYTASHLINRAYAPHLKKLELTYPQYITLTLLWERDQQMISEMAHQLEMESSTMTPLVKRLETLGFVNRNRGKADERQVFVELTSKGRKLQKNAPDITSCMVENTSLSHKELEQLQVLLAKLRDGFKAQKGT